MGPSNCLQVLHVEVSDQNAIICFLPRHVTLLDWTRKVWQTTPEDEAALLQRGDHEMWCLGCFSLLFPEFWTCNMLQHHDVGLWMGWYARSSQICYFLERLLSQKGLAFVRRDLHWDRWMEDWNGFTVSCILVLVHLQSCLDNRGQKIAPKCFITAIVGRSGGLNNWSWMRRYVVSQGARSQWYPPWKLRMPPPENMPSQKETTIAINHF